LGHWGLLRSRSFPREEGVSERKEQEMEGLQKKERTAGNAKINLILLKVNKSFFKVRST
jgi:hypothetical protein